MFALVGFAPPSALPRRRAAVSVPHEPQHAVRPLRHLLCGRRRTPSRPNDRVVGGGRGAAAWRWLSADD